jgi:hypothetical protein
MRLTTRAPRKPMHPDTTSKAKRIYGLWVVRPVYMAWTTSSVTGDQRNARSHVASRTRVVLSVPRHWLVTSYAPGILFRFVLTAFCF